MTTAEPTHAAPSPARPAAVGDHPPVQRTTGRWVTLRPVRHADYDAIRLAELSDELGVRWRHRGSTPSPEAFAQALWAGVLVQYLVVDNDHHGLVGLVTAYNADLQSGTCHVGFARFDPADRSPGLVEGVLLVADHLFRHWTFRKLYGETLEFNLTNLGGVLGPLLTEEGRLRQHAFAGGRYWDLIHLALYREVWEAHRERLLPAGPEHPRARTITVVAPRGLGMTRAGADVERGAVAEAPPTFAEVMEVVAVAVGRAADDLSPDTLVTEACADSLDLYCLYVALDEWVPGFLLPRQLELDVATLADVHHYLEMRLEQRRDR